MSNNTNVIVDGEEENERLTSKEFVDLIPHLSVAQILQVEVLLRKEWKPLFFENSRLSYFCEVCKVVLCKNNLLAHVASKTHTSGMNFLKHIYHPEYTYPKVTNSKENNEGNRAKSSSSHEKKFVKNPLKRNLSNGNDAMTTDKKSTTDSSGTSNISDLNEIPEVIIIDDNDDDEEITANSPKAASPTKESQTIKPKITVSSFAKCVEKSTDDSITSKTKENQEKNDERKKNDEETKKKIYGFIGVEYVIKICGHKVATRYECGLCELNLSFEDMQKHLLGYCHRLKFCEKHFPTAIQQFRQYIVDVPADEHYKVMIPMLQKLAEAIEKRHGRSKPFDCTKNRLNEERIRVLTEVFARSHATEQEGPTFTHVINSKEVDQFIAKRNESNPQENVVHEMIFDDMKPSSDKNTPVVMQDNQIYNKPLVRMANEMRKDFQMSQPYQFQGLPFSGQSFLAPQPYMGQQPYMYQQPPFVQPQNVMQLQPQFNIHPTVDDETHKRMVEKFLKANSKDADFSSSRSHRHGRHNQGERYHRNDRHDVHNRDRHDLDRCDRGRNDRDRHDRNRNDRDRHDQRHDHDSPVRYNNSAYQRYAYSPPCTSRSYSSSSNDPKTSHDGWHRYYRLVDQKLKELNECYEKYKANPESHPCYNQEWLKFWHRRKAELVVLGKDYRTYDYQPDWVSFFNKRIKEMYDEAFESMKMQLREELSLPLTNDFVSYPKYFVRAKQTENNKRDKSIMDQSNINEFVSPRKVGKMDTIATRIPNINEFEENALVKQKQKSNVSIRIEDDETPTFVSVLRLLTALEDHLGSLGPKIVELLAKALQAEKSTPALGRTLINEENCTLLETAMEKFKGLVITGILESAKERALKKAIAKVAAFLEVAKKTREAVAKHPAMEEEPKKTHAIEERIAAALAAQGHTNYDREKLEQLATVCMLLDKKKREGTTTATNADTQPSTLRSQPLGQKPLSDALSDIMGNFGSSGVQPAAKANADSGMGRLTTSIANQHQNSLSSSSYANTNLTNIGKNFGNTYSNNVLNTAPQNSPNVYFGNLMGDRQHHQQKQQIHSEQQNRSYNWNRAGNQTWGTNERKAYYPGPPNRPPMGQDQHM